MIIFYYLKCYKDIFTTQKLFRWLYCSTTPERALTSTVCICMYDNDVLYNLYSAKCFCDQESNLTMINYRPLPYDLTGWNRPKHPQYSGCLSEIFYLFMSPIATLLKKIGVKIARNFEENSSAKLYYCFSYKMHCMHKSYSYMCAFVLQVSFHDY